MKVVMVLFVALTVVAAAVIVACKAVFEQKGIRTACVVKLVLGLESPKIFLPDCSGFKYRQSPMQTSFSARVLDWKAGCTSAGRGFYG